MRLILAVFCGVRRGREVCGVILFGGGRGGCTQPSVLMIALTNANSYKFAFLNLDKRIIDIFSDNNFTSTEGWRIKYDSILPRYCQEWLSIYLHECTSKMLSWFVGMIKKIHYKQRIKTPKSSTKMVFMHDKHQSQHSSWKSLPFCMDEKRL